MSKLSHNERKLIEALPRFPTVKAAAKSLGLTPNHAGYILYSVRRKMDVWETDLKHLKTQMRSDPLTKKVLTSRR